VESTLKRHMSERCMCSTFIFMKDMTSRMFSTNGIGKNLLAAIGQRASVCSMHVSPAPSVNQKAAVRVVGVVNNKNSRANQSLKSVVVQLCKRLQPIHRTIH
jgi:hypothetical protein